MRIRPFRALYPNVDLIASTDLFFAEIKNEFVEYVQSGFFDKTPELGFYIYQIQTPQQQYTGVITCVDIHDYFDHNIKKHEKTLAAKEQKQMHILLRINAMTKPVLLTYPQVPDISALLQNYIAQHDPFFVVPFQDGAQQHRIWHVTDAAWIANLQALFEQKVKVSYIADGHHRCSTTALLYEKMYNRRHDLQYDWLLAAFFGSDQLVIHDYNRVVEDAFAQCSVARFMAQLATIAEIGLLAKAQRPTQKYELTFCIGQEWFSLRWKPAVLEKYKDTNPILDATLLNEEILRAIIGIQEVRTDTRVQYVEGVRGLEGIGSSMAKLAGSVGFCLYPVSFDDLYAVADADQSLPPKSTWFEPRMKNGLIIKEF